MPSTASKDLSPFKNSAVEELDADTAFRSVKAVNVKNAVQQIEEMIAMKAHQDNLKVAADKKSTLVEVGIDRGVSMDTEVKTVLESLEANNIAATDPSVVEVSISKTSSSSIFTTPSDVELKYLLGSLKAAGESMTQLEQANKELLEEILRLSAAGKNVQSRYDALLESNKILEEENASMGRAVDDLMNQKVRVDLELLRFDEENERLRKDLDLVTSRSLSSINLNEKGSEGSHVVLEEEATAAIGLTEASESMDRRILEKKDTIEKMLLCVIS